MRNDWKTKKKVWWGVSSFALAAGIFGAQSGQLPGMQPVRSCYAAEQVQPAATWDFSQDLQGWKYGGCWAYDGTPVVAWDKSYTGSMKVSVDFRSHVHDSWSEVKFEAGKLNGGKSISLSASNMLSFEALLASLWVRNAAVPCNQATLGTFDFRLGSGMRISEHTRYTISIMF